MRTTDLERYPTIEESIPISQDDYERIARAMDIEHNVKELIFDLLLKASTKVEDRKRAVWDELAQRFGFKTNFDVEVAEKLIEISWATRQLNLRVKDPTQL